MINKKLLILVLLSIIFTSNSLILNAKQNDFNPREIIDLNGEWFCEIGGEKSKPAEWSHKIPVPGLVDLITPEIKWEKAKYFWYKKKIFIPSNKKHSSAFIKIEQSKYGTQVWFNGENVGNYIGCYTSSEYDVTNQIKYGEENVLLIRVGQKDALSPQGAVGGDGEKNSFIPGIWGDVFLIQTGSVRIESVQVIPDIDKKIAENRINIRNQEELKKDIIISVEVEEKKTGKVVAKADRTVTIEPLEKLQVTLNAVISKMRLWSPEDPFLYKLNVTIKNKNEKYDRMVTVFGMRKFEIKGSDFYLNGKRIFLRGSNIAFHRFLSDPNRSNLVWDKRWIKKILINIPKEHNFNYFRNHLGQMYNRWYDIADEYGMLIHNEWAFWQITGKKGEIIKELKQWVIDNFNHPSIIIWDALNEPNDDSKEAKMIKNEIIPEVRKIDPTRPWEYSDFIEEHPYIYSLGPVINDKKFGFSRAFNDIAESDTPTLLNEFLWFWLSKDGKPTSLMNDVVPRWLGRNSTVEKRFYHQAMIATDIVEMYRRIRVDGIAPFVYLSIEDEKTSNWFTGNIANPGLKPIMTALKNAFAPLGVSIELWDRHFYKSERKDINVYIFNDYSHNESCTLICSIKRKNEDTYSNIGKYSVNSTASGTLVKPVKWKMPSVPGTYYLEAQIIQKNSTDPVAVSRKIIHVFDKPEVSSDIKNKHIMVYDSDGEIRNYLRTEGIKNVSGYNSTRLADQDILIIGEGMLLGESYKSQIPEITKFITNGHSILIMEPAYGFNSTDRKVIPVAEEFNLSINKSDDRWVGGYDSYFFPKDKKITLWNNLDGSHFKMFNGGLGGVIISQHEVALDRRFRIIAESGPGLKKPVVMETICGNGIIVVSRIQIRGRLMPDSVQGKDLYFRKVDPVARQYLLNLISTYIDTEKNLKRIKLLMPYDIVNTSASSIENNNKKLSSAKAVDGILSTRWSSEQKIDPQWIVLDLGQKRRFNKVILNWEWAYSKRYDIQVSDDNINWRTVYSEKSGNGQIDEIHFDMVNARYVRMYGIERVQNSLGHSLYEFEVYMERE